MGDIYFWYAERDEKTQTYERLNQSSGLVSDCVSAAEAWNQALQDARRDLGNTKSFTIKQFNKVG